MRNEKIIIFLTILIVIFIMGCQQQIKTYEVEYNESKMEIAKQKVEIIQLTNLIEKHSKDIVQIKYFFKGKIEYEESMEDGFSAEEEYDNWAYLYDEGYLFDSISYCVKARDYYSKANGHNQKAIQYFKKVNSTLEEFNILANKYTLLLDKDIDINWAMYEACEYYESASSSYDKGDYDTGDNELKIGNKRINTHDNLIKGFNEIYAEIELLEEEI